MQQKYRLSYSNWRVVMNKPTRIDLVDFAMMLLVIVLFAYTVALIASTASDIL